MKWEKKLFYFLLMAEGGKVLVLHAQSWAQLPEHTYTTHIQTDRHVGEETGLDSTMKAALNKVINYEVAYTAPPQDIPGIRKTDWCRMLCMGLLVCCLFDWSVCWLFTAIVQRDLEMGFINCNASGCRRGAFKGKCR